MKITIKKSLLLNNLNKVTRAISGKAFDPALSSVKLDLDSKGLTLLGYNGDIAIKSFIKKNDDMMIEEEGKALITAKYFQEIVSKTPSESISIEVLDDYKILLSAGKSIFNLNGISTKEYPDVNLETKDQKIEVPGTEFKEAIKQIAFATSLEEDRPIITGINIKITGNVMQLCATDSYRLARRYIKLDNKIKDTVNVTIPKTNAQELLNLIADNDEKIKFSFFDNRLIAEYANFVFETRLINGSYPEVSNLFPTDFVLDINIDVNKLYKAIEMVSILIKDEEHSVVALEIKGNEMSFTLDSQEVGRAYQEIELDKEYADFKITFSSKFMLESLASFKSEKILLQFVSNSKPIVLSDTENNNLSHLVLPRRS